MLVQIGYVGLGIIGHGMVKNLIEKGFDLTIWNRTESKMDEFISKGAKAAPSLKELAENCDVIIICVSDTLDVEEVMLCDNGILSGLGEGKLVIDHSTISPHASIELAKVVNEKGAHWLDAPVSGGSEGAENGTLSIMVGGDKEQFERALPIMQSVGKAVTLVGDQGAGQMVKLVNQILVVVTGMAVSEAMVFAQASGLDLDRTLNAVEGGAAGSWMLSNRGSQMIVRDWRPGFTIDLQQKDLRLVLEAADKLGIPLLATSLVFQLYRTLQDQGHGAEGNHALVKAIEKLSNVKVGE
jgi:3-hydroxyisobutyrate dehydrogenase